MPGWRLGDARLRPERRVTEDRRSGRDRRAPLSPPVPPPHRRQVVRPTGRQLQILALVADGARTADVARALVIDPQTVKRHLDDARARLKARTLPQAVAVCLVRGWLIPNR